LVTCYAGTTPNMIQYFNMLNYMKNSEYLTAKRNNKVNVHLNKWSYLWCYIREWSFDVVWNNCLFVLFYCLHISI